MSLYVVNVDGKILAIRAPSVEAALHEVKMNWYPLKDVDTLSVQRVSGANFSI